MICRNDKLLKVKNRDQKESTWVDSMKSGHMFHFVFLGFDKCFVGHFFHLLFLLWIILRIWEERLKIEF